MLQLITTTTFPRWSASSPQDEIVEFDLYRQQKLNVEKPALLFLYQHPLPMPRVYPSPPPTPTRRPQSRVDPDQRGSGRTSSTRLSPVPSDWGAESLVGREGVPDIDSVNWVTSLPSSAQETRAESDRGIESFPGGVQTNDNSYLFSQQTPSLGDTALDETQPLDETLPLRESLSLEDTISLGEPPSIHEPVRAMPTESEVFDESVSANLQDSQVSSTSATISRGDRGKTASASPVLLYDANSPARVPPGSLIEPLRRVPIRPETNSGSSLSGTDISSMTSAPPASLSGSRTDSALSSALSGSTGSNLDTRSASSERSGESRSGIQLYTLSNSPDYFIPVEDVRAGPSQLSRRSQDLAGQVDARVPAEQQRRKRKRKGVSARAEAVAIGQKKRRGRR